LLEALRRYFHELFSAADYFRGLCLRRELRQMLRAEACSRRDDAAIVAAAVRF